MKIIAFTGLSGVGKDTIINRVSYDTKIPIIVSHTSRSMRPSEIDGISYHFVSDDYFEDNKDKFIEQRVYKVKDTQGKTSIWRYGIHEDSVSEGNNLVIVDPPGLQDLIKYYGKENIITFYIHATDDTRMRRLKERGDFKNMEEVKRRQHDDKIRFSKFIESKEYYKICNEFSIDLAVKEIESILHKLGVI